MPKRTGRSTEAGEPGLRIPRSIVSREGSDGVPRIRWLRVYAFDPQLSTRLATAGVNEVELPVPWETHPATGEGILEPGPVGDYLEVVDHDPASDCFYEPVDLDHPHVIAGRGLTPADGNPRFHQQMVYAVAMVTIGHFERALGRRILWSPRAGDDGPVDVPRLRVYPHALREANAYYDPDKKALLFGYFPAQPAVPGGVMPGGIVFTCLSHDVIVHETTHAIVDGLHPHFGESTNVDVHAFHEAFADIVAILQHFSHPEVVRHQIAETRGDLARQNLLGKLAQQVGLAVGYQGALRDALGTFGDDGSWSPTEPDPNLLARTHEPHARGSILVAALFRAFLSIYRSRIRDLVRIAAGSPGVTTGELHPDLVDRLAREAGKSATHLLHMSIRALDYCPPVDVTFGDFLRAMITADVDMVDHDRRDYRVALIDAFRRWGIYPLDVRTMGVDSLVWRAPSAIEHRFFDQVFSGSLTLDELALRGGPRTRRADVFARMRENTRRLEDEIRSPRIQDWLTRSRRRELRRTVGLELTDDAPRTVPRRRDGRPEVEIHTVRPTVRRGPDGEIRHDLLVQLTQQRYGFRDPKRQAAADRNGMRGRQPDFVARGGCAVLIDIESRTLRYVIRKRLASEGRLERQRDLARRSFGDPLREAYGGDTDTPRARTFASLHRRSGGGGGETWPEA